MALVNRYRSPRFRVLARAALIAIAVAAIVSIQPTAVASTSNESGACVGFIRGAEKSQGIPEGLLLAIGYTESGRVIPDGRRVPWPWTVNAQGQSYVFDSKVQAIVFVQDLQAEGVSVIDVGCMQVNLYYHPDAFASLDTAFDPATNVAYAAQFLKELQSESGDWGIAAQHYHSRTSYLGRVYVGQVIANGFGEISSDIEPIAPLSAKERAMLAEAVPDHVTAANELIAMSPAKWKPQSQAMAVRHPVAIGESATQIKELLD